jgi:hypothetical protein
MKRRRVRDDVRHGNLRRGHYDIATEVPSRHRLRAASDDLALAI